MPRQTALLRDHCLSLFNTGIAAADPYAAVARCLHWDGKALHIGWQTRQSRRGQWSKIHLLAFGKAACRMAAAVRNAIPKHLLAEPGIIVTNYGNAADLQGFITLGAGHPLPDANGLQAARTIADRAASAQAGELVLVLISGGGSALLPYPVEGVSLEDKIATTQQLLACGATINDINCVRKHLSRLKGGGLARLAAPADVHALVLSDVLGDELSAIASGPTVADDSRFADAIRILHQYDVWRRLPASVQSHLQQGADGLRPETLKSADPLLQRISNTLVGGNALSVDAVSHAAQQLGYRPTIFSRRLTGEARLAGEQLARHCHALRKANPSEAIAVIAGGETTVTLTGSGKGGRNQELALVFALSAERIGLNGGWRFLSGGTDGIDGPTDAAGGVAEANTLDKIRAAGIDPQAALQDNDTYTALQAADALVFTGATGTNVADLQIALLAPITD